MNYLTLIMAIPLVGAALIATLPQAKSLLAKQFALGTTLVAAVATILMTVNSVSYTHLTLPTICSV